MNEEVKKHVIKRTDWFNASIVTNNLKLFTFFAAVSIKPLYCNLQRVLFLFTYAKLEYVSVYVRILEKTEYVSYGYVSWSPGIYSRRLKPRRRCTLLDGAGSFSFAIFALISTTSERPSSHRGKIVF